MFRVRQGKTGQRPSLVINLRLNPVINLRPSSEITVRRPRAIIRGNG